MFMIQLRLFGGCTMNELANCANCNRVFVKSVRKICRDCYEAEEKAFETVYQFLTRRNNREATLLEIVEATQVEEELITKFIKEKRLRTSQFPKLAYPCEKCENNIVSGRLCRSCSQEWVHGLKQHQELEARRTQEEMDQKKRSSIYYAFDKRDQ